MLLRLKVLLWTLLLMALASPSLSAPLTLSGSVTYVERIALPEDAVLHLRLIDQNAPGAPARIDVRAAIGAGGQVPLNFSLAFDDQIILPDHSYAIIAEILSGGRLWFRNFEAYGVSPLAPAAPIELTVSFVGEVTTDTLTATEDEMPATAPALPILGVVWHGKTLAGQPILSHTDPTFSIGTDNRAGGRGSCNSYFTQVVLDDLSLHVGPITSTKKSCGYDTNMQEQAFFGALRGASSYLIAGDTLTLLDAAGVALATLTR
jgi:putative lipoprotein